MKQVPSDKYNIAWFRLAEYVARGEKERALGVYRLLSHSLDDSAFARQLEGDILLSFGDAQALVCYQDAALLYKNAGLLRKAAAVYEHLHELNQSNPEYISALLELYCHSDVQNRAQRVCDLACRMASIAGVTHEQMCATLALVLDYCLLRDDRAVIQDFVARLEQINSAWHAYATSLKTVVNS